METNNKPKRLFIEDDAELDEGQFRTMLRTCTMLAGLGSLDKTGDKFFDTVIVDALTQTTEVWEAIKQHDEIYADTALIPLFGFGSSLGSGMLFNSMMYKAIEEGVTNKNLFIKREIGSIQWDELRPKLLLEAFKNNKIFVINEDGDAWIEVDIVKLVKDTFGDEEENGDI